MGRVESRAQVDNTLIMSVSALLAGSRTDPIADITNLMTFVHATILFDRVAIPIWDTSYSAIDHLPSSIVPKGVFEDVLAPDFHQHIEDCVEESLTMGQSSACLPFHAYVCARREAGVSGYSGSSSASR